MKTERVKLHLSGGWDEVLLKSIRYNTEECEELISIKESKEEQTEQDREFISVLKDSIDRNRHLTETIEKYKSADGWLYLFPSEAGKLIWLLLENFNYLFD